MGVSTAAGWARTYSSLLKQRDDALTRAQNIDGITSDSLTHPLVDFTDDESFDEAFNYANAGIDELISMDSQDLFYIGICFCPYRRFKGSDDLEIHYRGHEQQWRWMHLLVSCNGPTSARLEKALLATWRKHPRCTNKALGGGRRRPCDTVAFVYCCIGNWDRRQRPARTHLDVYASPPPVVGVEGVGCPPWTMEGA